MGYNKGIIKDPATILKALLHYVVKHWCQLLNVRKS